MKKILLSMFLLMSLTGCASSNNVRINDPFEPVNRVIFDFNMKADEYVLTPVSKSYKYIVPEPGRNGIKNFLDNLRSPINFANYLLQGDIENATKTFTRFSMNTVLGLGGILDPATEFNVISDRTSFGDTLSIWGVEEGPYLMLPILGPSTVKDTTGLFIDIALDPIYWSGKNSENYIIKHNTIFRGVTRAIDNRSRNYQKVDNIRNNSLDPYASVRSLYLQHNKKNNNEIIDEYSFDNIE